MDLALSLSFRRSPCLLDRAMVKVLSGVKQVGTHFESGWKILVQHRSLKDSFNTVKGRSDCMIWY